MRPVRQTDDCLAACFASILERELDELPDIGPDDVARLERWRDWLHEQGWDCFHVRSPTLDDPTSVPRGPWIAIYGDAHAIREQVSNLMLGIPIEDEDSRPTHAVIYRGNEIAFNPWGIHVDPSELGDLLAGLVLVPLMKERTYE